jgi:nanoRNase/pAp phosphatase (c-di-AMP/oligoRNAs hydrolase)
MDRIFDSIANAVKKYKNIAVIIKGSPDPDAIASSWLIKSIAEFYGTSADIIAMQQVSLNQNKVFISILNIPVHFDWSLTEKNYYDAYIVADHQTARVPELHKNIPCAVHIDHHDPLENDVEADLRILNSGVNATSAMLAAALRDMENNLTENMTRSLSTALLFGIEIDTDRYTYTSSEDHEAIEYLARHADSSILERLNAIPVSKSAASKFKSAHGTGILYKDWFIAGLGYIPVAERDSIAVVADMLLRKDDHTTVVTYALIEDEKKHAMVLDASFRTKNSKLNLNVLIKRITSSGGASSHKGAFQIDCSYFSNCPDRDLFWSLVQSTTIEVLKARRDDQYMIEIKSAYNTVKSRIKKIFRTD